MRFNFKKDQGSILSILLITGVLIGVVLASYLKLVSNQNTSIQRSQQWNSALAVAEAGVEEAMAQLYANNTNRATEGWTLEVTNVVRSRSLDANTKYKVYIQAAKEPPYIFSRGMVRIPQTGKYIERTIQTMTTNHPLFTKAMAADGTINLSGNKVRIDSFDSSNPAKSNGGKYDVALAGDKGDIATNSSIVNDLNTGNADIYGHTSTGPGGKTGSSVNGSIGSLAWHAGGNKGIEDGWNTDDMNVQFPVVEVPFTGGSSTPLSGNYPGNPPAGTNYALIVNSGKNLLSSINMSSGTILVPPPMIAGTPTILYVTGDIKISGTAKIVIAKGANLQLYVAGSSTDIAGKGLINENNSALNFGYWGLPSNKSVSFSGNATFTGTIYAPQAHLTLGGGGATTWDFSGASVSKSAKVNGIFQFHYDEAIGKFGPKPTYTITSWKEIKWVGP